MSYFLLKLKIYPKMFICRAVIFILLINFCCALFQDQIGKFDWRKRFLGCPHQTWFGNIDSEKFLLTISKENVIGRIDVGNGEIVWRQINDKSSSADEEQIELLKVEPSSILIKFGQKLRSFDPHTGAFQWQKKLNIEKKEIVENGILKSKYDAENNVEIFDDKTEEIIKFNIKDESKINELKVLHSVEDEENKHYKIFVHWKDCRMEIYEFSQHKNKLNLLWSRPESLATISDVLLVDLPLSESQAQIESEFNLNEPILRSFGLRIWSQLEQLHRFLLKTIKRALRAMDVILFILQGKVDYSALFQKQLFAFIDGTKDEPLERDYFNMRKIIVVSTFSGTLHGLSSDDGKLLWTFHLGDKFMPYKNKKVPLYLLRGTAFYQWGSQAATVFNVKNSVDSIILTFNPISGEFIDKIEISGGLSRVELCPFLNSEQLHSLIIRRNNRPNNVELWPQNVGKEFQKPIYLMDVEQNSGNLRGFVILKDNELNEKWHTKLPNFNKNDEIIELIQGKHLNVKMHSPGRVLGDRSVLYKYSNPNLVAILSSNKNEMSLRLNLVDSVSGELIYTGKYSRALPPFHLVHCENWIVLTYWNEKARRTEIGIIELFEGEKQTNSTAFDSFSAIKEPVKIISQSYIFPQGISAMAVSDTEQGLTSRSILIGTPFGGILELSRRLLDARRPLEMTPELREEMLIPYIPELPMATEDLINYNQTVAKIRCIRTTPSGLESSSLVFAYGLDLFYTRIMPSGTFDILKDDFDYFFISAVMVLLTVASYICKRISRYQSIQKAWE